MKHLAFYGIPGAILLLLTGGFGLWVVPIRDLACCSDYQVGRAAQGAALVIALLAVTGFRASSRKSFGLVLGIALALAASLPANWYLEQDPLAAWLNWRAPRIDFKAKDDGTYSIENREKIWRNPTTGEICARPGA